MVSLRSMFVWTSVDFWAGFGIRVGVGVLRFHLGFKELIVTAAMRAGNLGFHN